MITLLLAVDMFTFGKGLKKAKHDIIAYDLLFKSIKRVASLNKDVNIYYNLKGEVITVNGSYNCHVKKIRLGRTRIDKGLFSYKYGFEVFANRPPCPEGYVVVPVIIPKDSYYSYNLYGHILSSAVIYPNKFTMGKVKVN